MADIVFSREIASTSVASSVADASRGTVIDGRQLRSTVASQAVGLQSPQFSLEQGRKIAVQEANRFISDNSDLLAVISKDGSGHAARVLEQSTVSTRKDLEGVIAKAAADHVQQSAAGDSLNADFFRRHVKVAALVVMNTGGIRDALRQSEAARNLVASGEPQPDAVGYETLAKKAAALFSEDSALNDAAFFQDNPKIGEYLLARPDVVQQLTEYSSSSTAAQQFKSHALSSAYQSLFDTFVAQEADTQVDSGSYTQEFFAEHIDFAEYAVSGAHDSGTPTAAQVLKDHPEFVLGNVTAGDRFNLRNVMKSVVAEQASSKLGGASADEKNFLRDNTAIAQLVLANDRLANNLRSDAARDELSVVLGQRKGAVSESVAQSVRGRFQSTFAEVHAVSRRT